MLSYLEKKSKTPIPTKFSFDAIPLDHVCESQYNGGCNQVCTKEGASAVCSCQNSDYYLKLDGKTCAEGMSFNLNKLYNLSYTMKYKVWISDKKYPF